jgi:nucleotide-binding universal stress UspA family protein
MNSTMSTLHGVVVAVDDSEQGWAVARYAAIEAERLDVALDIVHIPPGRLPVAPTSKPLVPDTAFESYGARILAGAKEAALGAVPTTLEVGTHLRVGGRIPELVAFTEHARLMVLGNHSPKNLDRLWTGGTVTAIAGRAACPVIVVPAERDRVGTHGRIAIGWKSPGQTRELFDTGFQLAAEMRAELVVLHAWRLEGRYDDIIAHRAETQEWQREQTELIEHELTPYRAAFPAVAVRVFVRHEEPAHALARVARGADRLLISRHLCHAPGLGVGEVGRAVLREAHCPVEVLTPASGPGATSTSGVEHSAELVP